MTDEEFEKNMRRAFPFYDIKSGIDFKAEAPEFMKGQTPYKTATELYHGELMTKIDTKEIEKVREIANEFAHAVTGAKNPILFSNQANEFGKNTLKLCDAYDEAQKEILEKQGKVWVAEQSSRMILEHSSKRISTLEALLREAREKVCYNNMCYDCGVLDIIKSGHQLYCLFTRIQKELGEG